ncbi:hypothetical protein [Streptomyces sp. HF10]|uniref:hypothetical protein n=1 Tax=Streptomyces sp. HF10 TaxID=2692233 RepID=UPI0013165F89|nr:hypothetical protein [Streptomyces sp. HF10]QHC31117.1 hypothetical protein GR129_22340 [Streptomyces sp. HF10]
MPEGSAARLQIYSVEETTVTSAVCIVRCVGGVARIGQLFEVEPAPDQRGGGQQKMTLDWINRYQRRVEFFDPPHSAKVSLSGEGIGELKCGTVITTLPESENF